MAALLNPDTRRYLAREYPHNHCYRVVLGRLWPNRQLRRRARRIEALYPPALESLVDLSVSKGYFALHAGLRPGRPRVLGIDVNETAVELTNGVSDHLALDNVSAETIRLHDLATEIESFGGQFQTALAINMYQYLYYGGITEPAYYETHEEIFELLGKVCSGTLIFSNCVEFDRLPPWVRETAQAQDRVITYSEDRIRAAAEAHFHIEECGLLGRRPLWKMTALGGA
jgi:hypothetical protein